ncbi:unnamed protein product, partial [Discosporangium mesarthrocarpum]
EEEDVRCFRTGEGGDRRDKVGRAAAAALAAGLDFFHPSARERCGLLTWLLERNSTRPFPQGTGERELLGRLLTAFATPRAILSLQATLAAPQQAVDPPSRYGG